MQSLLVYERQLNVSFRKSVLPMVVFGAIEGEDITVDVVGEAAVVDAAPAAAATPAAGTVSLFVTVKVLAVIFNGYHGHNYTTDKISLYAWRPKGRPKFMCRITQARSWA